MTLQLPSILQQYSVAAINRTLYEDGSRNVALFGLGQLGGIPAELQKHRCVGSVNDAIKLFNSKLKSLVDDLNTNFPEATFTYINVYNILPIIGTLSVLDRPCCKVLETMTEGLCAPGEGPYLLRGIYLFYDNFHPTEIANRVAANRAYNALLPSDAHPMDIRHLIRNNHVYDD
ncbi:GDSL esterase/lipase At1g29670-like [Lycium ferocissimum]|uniref:GDSL esterase/lipase At1g29670-like n=1 Tax=Lycium ferocissimum TaxID=112874 RepID=UPI002815DF7A|nr:GDSL esterase/lipase At1g29670-like [Lycium ferocissimum]